MSFRGKIVKLWNTRLLVVNQPSQQDQLRIRHLALSLFTPCNDEKTKDFHYNCISFEQSGPAEQHINYKLS